MRLFQQKRMPFAKYPPTCRVLREVERLTRNPEKLANAGGRCWKNSLGRNKSFRAYQEKVGHCLARDQETFAGGNMDGQCQKGPEGENNQKLPGLGKRQKQKRSLEESHDSLIVGIADGGEKRREKIPQNVLQSWEFRGQQLSASFK